MSGTSMKKIQQAIYTKLTSDTQLMAIITGLYDDVPTNINTPYIVMGDVLETNFNTFDKSGRNTLFTLHIWSEYDGFAQCYDILERVNQLLDYQSLSVTGYNTVYCRFDTAQTLRDNDGYSFQLIAQYRIMVQES